MRTLRSGGVFLVLEGGLNIAKNGTGYHPGLSPNPTAGVAQIAFGLGSYCTAAGDCKPARDAATNLDVPARLFDAGKLRPHTERVYGLDGVPRAFTESYGGLQKRLQGPLREVAGLDNLGPKYHRLLDRKLQDLSKSKEDKHWAQWTVATYDDSECRLSIRSEAKFSDRVTQELVAAVKSEYKRDAEWEKHFKLGRGMAEAVIRPGGRVVNVKKQGEFYQVTLRGHGQSTEQELDAWLRGRQIRREDLCWRDLKQRRGEDEPAADRWGCEVDFVPDRGGLSEEEVRAALGAPHAQVKGCVGADCGCKDGRIACKCARKVQCNQCNPGGKGGGRRSPREGGGSCKKCGGTGQVCLDCQGHT
eukprot:gene1661-4388_t